MEVDLRQPFPRWSCYKAQQSSTSWNVCTIQLEMLVMAQVLQSWREQLMRRVMIVLGSPNLLEARAKSPSRRLVLAETQHDGGVEPDSDTDSVVYAWEDHHGEDPAEEDDRDSVVSGEQSVGSVEEEAMLFRLQELKATQAAFRVLDDVNLSTVFDKRACLMYRVPRFLRGPFRRALHVGLEEISEGCRVSDTRRQERGWKLFLLLPRMLLHRPPRGGMISRAQLISRFEMFIKGEWTALIRAGEACATQAGDARRRKRRREGGLAQRLSRAEALVHLGELSSARQALEGADLAPGNEETLNALRRRPAMPRDAIPPELTRHVPEVLSRLDEGQLNKNSRSAKRGAAPGPSGMTVEYLHPLFDHSGDLRLFVAAAEVLARGQVPESIQTAVKLGRMIALSKTDGGVRGIVAGDVIRRLVARTMSQQLMEAVQSATSPFQYAMATRAGCECISHVLQGLTELNPNATISVRRRNKRVRHDLQAGDVARSEQRRRWTVSAAFRASMFYGSPSQYLWEDERGVTHTIHQGESGEQGDTMMPLFAVLPWPAQSPAVGARRTSGGRSSTGFFGRHVSCHISRENHDSIRHIAGRFIDGGRHPPQPRQNKNLEFSRGETFRVQCFADGC